MFCVTCRFDNKKEMELPSPNMVIISQIACDVKSKSQRATKFYLFSKKAQKLFYKMSIVKVERMCYNETVKEVRSDEKVSLGLFAR